MLEILLEWLEQTVKIIPFGPDTSQIDHYPAALASILSQFSLMGNQEKDKQLPHFLSEDWSFHLLQGTQYKDYFRVGNRMSQKLARN